MLKRKTRPAQILAAVVAVSGCVVGCQSEPEMATSTPTTSAPSPTPKPTPKPLTAAEKQAQAKREKALKLEAARKAKAEALKAKREAHERAVAEAAEMKQRRQEEGIAWNYQTDEDKMGRGKVKVAYVKSLNDVNFDSPYEGSQKATLVLRKNPTTEKHKIMRL